MRKHLVLAMSAFLSLPVFAQGPKLFILDCGAIAPLNPSLFDLKAEEIKGPRDQVTPCYFIVHPRGTMLWDAGQIADEAFPADGKPAAAGAFTARISPASGKTRCG